MAEACRIDTRILKGYIAQYKTELHNLRLGEHYEIYKWKAVKCFQDHWDIQATDFLAMVKSALSQTKNLLASGNYYPRPAIEDMAGVAPEEMRAAFSDLFDESKDVVKRVVDFERACTRLLRLKPEMRQHYQTPNAISTYLWLRYPDKYYAYKYSVIKDNAMKLCGVDLPAGKLERMLFGFSLYDLICAEIGKEKELVAMSRKTLSEDCYPDESLKTLTIDIGYYISSHELDPQFLPERVAAAPSDKNIILYGPPGTGKTYTAVQYAVSIIEEKELNTVKAEDYTAVFTRFQKYRDDGLIAFTTFHQSFGYEEFIEGIRPVIRSDENEEDLGDIAYEVRDGIFKTFCNKAGTPISQGVSVDFGINKNPTIWKVSLEGTGENPTRTDCMENNHIRIGWDDYGDTISDDVDYSGIGGKVVLNAFYYGMQIGDIVMSCYSGKTVDAIGVITGDPEWHEEYEKFKRLRKVKWLVKGINEDIVDLNGGKIMTLSTVYRLSISVSDVLLLLKRLNPELFSQKVKIPNRVFIIDEINRGNISKIFGELITLIEPTKRIGASETLRAILPYSGQSFGVPDNVYVIGTMNTADRSIAMIDTALRRRFTFVEMQPDSGLLRDVFIGEIDAAEMLDTINRRIAILLDREHMIGHSYFLPLLNDASVESLAYIFERKIIPLLQEYFFDDYEKIHLVLGDNQKTDDSIRFIVRKADAVKLFGNTEVDFPEFYEINTEAFKRIEAYAYLN